MPTGILPCAAGPGRAALPARAIMRDSYTVTLPEEPPSLPDLHKDLRPRTSMPGSLLVSTFVGLVLNKTKVGALRPLASPALRLAGSEGGVRRGRPLPWPGSGGCPAACPLPEGEVAGGGCQRRPCGAGALLCPAGGQGAVAARGRAHGSLCQPAPLLTLAVPMCPASLPQEGAASHDAPRQCHRAELSCRRRHSAGADLAEDSSSEGRIWALM